jgi:DNA-binding XRE family transcriptional regulator
MTDVQVTRLVPRLALTYDEAAAAVGYSKQVIRAAIEHGDLVPSYGTRSKPVIRIAELERWLETLPTERRA